MQEFEVAYNQDKFQSIAVCTTVDTCVISHTKLTGASFITVLKSSSDNKCIKLLLLYKKHTLLLSTFCNWLQIFVTNNLVDLMKRYFNINGFNENIQLFHILSNYNHIYIDHGYINQEFPKQVNIDVITIYFSDHDAIKFELF